MTRRGSGFGLLGGGGFGLPIMGVATTSEGASRDEPHLRQAIAAMRANEVGEGRKRGVFFKGWVKLRAALELAAKLVQWSRPEFVDSGC
jgi:hypothetical protein